jgi:hypothetical protein
VLLWQLLIFSLYIHFFVNAQGCLCFKTLFSPFLIKLERLYRARLFEDSLIFERNARAGASTLSITTPGITSLFLTLSNGGTQHNNTAIMLSVVFHLL